MGKIYGKDIFSPTARVKDGKSGDDVDELAHAK